MLMCSFMIANMYCGILSVFLDCSFFASCRLDLLLSKLYSRLVASHKLSINSLILTKQGSLLFNLKFSSIWHTQCQIEWVRQLGMHYAECC